MPGGGRSPAGTPCRRRPLRPGRSLGHGQCGLGARTAVAGPRRAPPRAEGLLPAAWHECAQEDYGGRNGAIAPPTASSARETNARALCGLRASSQVAKMGLLSRYRTSWPGWVTPTSPGAPPAWTAVKPAARAAAVMAAAVPRMGALRLHPAVPIRNLASSGQGSRVDAIPGLAVAVVAEHAREYAATWPGHAGQFGEASARVGEVVEDERRDRVVTELAASGRARMSATAHGGREAACHSSMPADRSTANGLAPRRRSAALAAPVPAPASSTIGWPAGAGWTGPVRPQWVRRRAPRRSAHRLPDLA